MAMETPQQFLLEVKNELKKVSWPSKKAVLNLTLVVVIVSVIVGLLLTSVDFIFNKLAGLTFGR